MRKTEEVNKRKSRTTHSSSKRDGGVVSVKSRESHDSKAKPLTTADLKTPIFHYFTEQIQIKGVFKSELWQRQKIGHTLELGVESFLPVFEMSPSVLGAMWNSLAGSEVVEPQGVMRMGFEKIERNFKLICENVATGGTTAKSVRWDARYFVKPQRNPNSFQTAGALQISNQELQTLCEDLKAAITQHRREKILSISEAEEFAKYISATPASSTRDKIRDALDLEESELSIHRKNLPQDRVMTPSIADFIRLGFIFSADQITHKLLCKMLAIIPDITFCLRPIKGFAVVTTPMSIKLMSKDAGEETRRRTGDTFQTGYITLDQERRVVPLHESDPKVKVYTLVGIWVSGLQTPQKPKTKIERSETAGRMDSAGRANLKKQKFKELVEREDCKSRVLRHPGVLAAMLRFAFSEEIASRIAPRPREKEARQPSYLLVNFIGHNSLPQFLEFELKGNDKAQTNGWMMMESAHSIPREPKSGFNPIKMRLTSNSQSVQDIEGFCVYRLSNIISLLQETQQPRKIRKEPLATISKTSQENMEPNRAVTCMKMRKNKIQESSSKQTQLKMSNEKVLKLASGQVKLLSERQPQVIQLKNAKEMHPQAPFLVDEPQEMMPTTTTKESMPQRIPFRQASADLVDDRSMEISLDSTGLRKSKLNSRLHSGLSSRKGMDYSSSRGQFPSYSGNVSLLYTPEYNSMGSTGSISPYMQKIFQDQENQINELKRMLAYLMEEIQVQKAGKDTSAIAGMNFSAIMPQGSGPGFANLNLSSDGMMHPLPNPQRLNFSQNLGQCSPSFMKGTPAENNSFANNSISNLKNGLNLVFGEKDAHCVDTPSETKKSRNSKKMSFTLDASNLDIHIGKINKKNSCSEIYTKFTRPVPKPEEEPPQIEPPEMTLSEEMTAPLKVLEENTFTLKEEIKDLLTPALPENSFASKPRGSSGKKSSGKKIVITKPAMIHTKSDWSMDMPHIIYKVEDDEEE